MISGTHSEYNCPIHNKLFQVLDPWLCRQVFYKSSNPMPYLILVGQLDTPIQQ